MEILQILLTNQSINIAFAVFKETTLFPVRENDKPDNNNTTSVVGSQVVSASVAGIADGTMLNTPITISLRLTNTPTLRPNETVTDRRCVFWDYNAASKTTTKFTHNSRPTYLHNAQAHVTMHVFKVLPTTSLVYNCFPCSVLL